MQIAALEKNGTSDLIKGLKFNKVKVCQPAPEPAQANTCAFSSVLAYLQVVLGIDQYHELLLHSITRLFERYVNKTGVSRTSKKNNWRQKALEILFGKNLKTREKIVQVLMTKIEELKKLCSQSVIAKPMATLHTLLTLQKPSTNPGNHSPLALAVMDAQHELSAILPNPTTVTNNGKSPTPEKR